jgi:signal transduction histidine kinase/response regulator RpfG family c-di-GMP phosphodiesterase
VNVQGPERNNRILVIDDNRAIHDDFRKILNGTARDDATLVQAEAVLFEEEAQSSRLMHFQIDSAYQGEEGLARVQLAVQAQHPYAVAFVDIRMPPGWDGVETTQRLWEVDPDLQVVICTAYSDYSWDELLRKIGYSDRLLILKKPFDTIEVLQLAHALTEKRWLLQQVKNHIDDLEWKVAERTRELEQTNETLRVEVSERKQAESTLRTKTEQLQAITDAMVAFLQSGGERLPSEILLRCALRQTNSVCGFVAMVEGGSKLRILAHECAGWDHTILERLLEDTIEPVPAEGCVRFAHLKDLFRSVITGGQTVTMNTPVVGPPSADPVPPDAVPLQRFLGMPIFNGTQVAGMVGVANRPGEYTDADQSHIEVLTRAAGILFDGYQRQQRETALEEQLRQSQKVEAIGRLAGGVAHDFNNILTAILGYGELMLMKMKPDDPLRGNTEEIRKAAERAAALTRQLLAFSRKQILEPKVLNLNEVVNELSKMLSRMIDEDIELTIHGAKDLGRVRVDPGQIEQVIINMAVNARDAMPKGGKLTIETGDVVLDESYAAEHADVAPGNYVTISISDTGTGMDAEVRSRLFEPFFTTKEKGKGTGLGLATCYGIVKQSGGHISVYSEPGCGTTFRIYLPQIQEPSSAKAKRGGSNDLPRGTETVLLVEDEPALRKLAALVLQGLGYSVMEASNGREALQVAETLNGRGVDLLLTDVVMPKMGGKELADHIHAAHPDTRILFSSGYTEDAIVHHGVLDDGIAFLHKPYTTDVLARKVREVLDGPGMPANGVGGPPATNAGSA